MDYELAARFCALSNDATVRNNRNLVRIFVMTGKLPPSVNEDKNGGTAAAMLKVMRKRRMPRKAWMGKLV